MTITPNPYPNPHRVLSCTHVIGMNMSYITACNYNRRAFVCCCIDSFSSFPQALELTIIEAYHILRLICIDFPRSRIEEAIYPLVSSSTNTSANSRVLVDNPKFLVHTFQAALYFSILYEDWIRVVTTWFEHIAYNTPLGVGIGMGVGLSSRSGSTSGSGSPTPSSNFSSSNTRVIIPVTQLNLQKLNQQMSQLRTELPVSFNQPHIDGVNSVIAVITNNANTANNANTTGTGTGGSGKTLSLDHFLKEMFSNPIIAMDLFRKPLACQNMNINVNSVNKK